MRRRGKIQALLAVLLITVMMIGSIPMDAIAVQAEEEPEVITAFDEPVIEITVEGGIKEIDIPFPEKLTVQLAGGENKDIPVTWEDAEQKYNMDEPGTYTFTAKLEVAYIFDGTLPVAQVKVTESEPDVAAENEEQTETPELEESETTGSESETEPEQESEKEAEPAEYQNKISGFVWADKVLDGNYDSDAADENNREWVIKDYQIYLLKADDQSVVAETVTDEKGNYEFTNIEPGKYVVKPHYNTPDTGDYRRSRLGVVGRNKIEAATGTTAVLEVQEDSDIKDQDIGMKVKPNFQLKANATYTIDITSSTTVNNSITMQSIPGVAYSGNILRFNTAVNSTDKYIITGGLTYINSIEINTGSGTTLNITLQDVKIETATSPIAILGTSKVELGLDGTNTLTCTGTSTNSGAYQAGINVGTTTTLTIDSATNGVLNATGGACATGIGSTNSKQSGTIIINGGTANATGTAGAGIGGGGSVLGSGINTCTTVTINGGTVTATSNQGAGIGGGQGTDGNGCVININGGTVTATSKQGAGIGGGQAGSAVNNSGGSGDISITGGIVTATSTNAAGIGGGFQGNGNTITISGGKVTATSINRGAGIGGGTGGAYGRGHSGTITITGTADVKAKGGTGGGDTAGAGIGGAANGNANTITISGGIVDAEAGESTSSSKGGGAGIGGGAKGNGSSGGAGGVIRITGGKVLARGSKGSSGAGIGGGYMGTRATTLEIGAAAEVYAYSYNPAYPALWGVMSGSGYYTNAYFGDGPLSYADDFDLRVHSGNYIGSYIDSVPLPAGYRCFAYTTGGTSRVYQTRGINTATGIDHGQVVDYDTNNWSILVSKNGGYAQESTLYKVKLYALPFLGDLWHDNVAQTTADLISKDHTFSLGTQNYGYFDYDLNGSFAPGYTRLPWSSTTTNPYTAHLSGLTPNSMYYYRVYLKNEFGDATSVTKRFLTLPKISSWSATGTNLTNTIVAGSITASANNNPITGVKVTIATDSGFTSGVQTRTLTLNAGTNGFTDTSFTADFGILTPGAYYAKVEVSNVSGVLGGVTTETLFFMVSTTYTITEKYVGRSSGTAIDSVGLPDTTAYATGSYTPAAGIPPANHTVGGDTYIYLGYKLDSYTPGNPISSGTPSAVTISSNRTVYYIYDVFVDVAISKKVTGAYGDPNKLFDIKVTLKDSSNAPVTGTYSYNGSAIGGVTPPAGGGITFNGSGEGTIRLKHGQTIMIKNIPKGYTVTVQETDAAITSGLYDVTYSGTGTVSGTGASAVVSQTLGGTAANVSITNNRSTVPSSGLKGSDYQMASVGVLSVLALAGLMLFGYRRRRKCN